MNTTVTVQVDNLPAMTATEALRIMSDVENLPAVKQAIAEFSAEDCSTAQLAERDALRGPYRVGEFWPSDDRIVLALCRDSEYRMVRYSDGRWYLMDTPWRAVGEEVPMYWWDLPEVTP